MHLCARSPEPMSRRPAPRRRPKESERRRRGRVFRARHTYPVRLMKLLNFSIGRVQTHQIGGESVRTAHVKSPAVEPWLVMPEGAEGDERAVHLDKIYAYARTH